MHYPHLLRKRSDLNSHSCRARSPGRGLCWLGAPGCYREGCWPAGGQSEAEGGRCGRHAEGCACRCISRCIPWNKGQGGRVIKCRICACVIPYSLLADLQD
eukprot:1158540-Pelagomonas_calceolata.AAC.3